MPIDGSVFEITAGTTCGLVGLGKRRERPVSALPGRMKNPGPWTGRVSSVDAIPHWGLHGDLNNPQDPPHVDVNGAAG
jgi:hypothetical protein